MKEWHETKRRGLHTSPDARSLPEQRTGLSHDDPLLTPIALAELVELNGIEPSTS
jgi:hypothetical protein